MGNLLFAILMALNALFPPSGTLGTATNEERLEKAQYILDNDLYRTIDGGVIIDPDVSV